MNAVGVFQNSKVETYEFDVRSFVSHRPLGILNGFPYKIYGYCVTFHNIPIRYVPVCLLDEIDIYIYIYLCVCLCLCLYVCVCVCVSFFCVSMTSLSKAIFFSIFWYNSPIRILAFNTFKAQRLLCVYPGFNKNLRSAPHSISVCFVWISVQTAIFSLNSIN